MDFSEAQKKAMQESLKRIAKMQRGEDVSFTNEMTPEEQEYYGGLVGTVAGTTSPMKPAEKTLEYSDDILRKAQQEVRDKSRMQLFKDQLAKIKFDKIRKFLGK